MKVNNGKKIVSREESPPPGGRGTFLRRVENKRNENRSYKSLKKVKRSSEVGEKLNEK
jgi:hypothetical protein